MPLRGTAELPRKAGYLNAPDERRAPEAVGRALQANYVHLDHRKITEAVTDLKRQYGLLQKLVIQNVPSRHSKLKSQLGAPVELLERTRVLLCWKQDEEMIKEMVRQRHLRPESKEKYLGPISDRQRGLELMDCLNQSGEWITSFREDSDPIRAALAQQAAACRDLIMAELARHGILKICPNCGNTFHPARRTKEYCTRDYEGRGCGGNVRRRRSSRSHRYNRA
jgi:hypothetical protein